MFGRREVLLAGAAAGLLPRTATAARQDRPRETFLAAQRQWTDPPLQVPTDARLRQLGRTRLFAWDSGGPGEAVVLLHPMTGSHAVWLYQQPVFAKVGYRVIGYSRRGFFQSDAHRPDVPAADADDLQELLDHLGIEHAHIVAAAAGGFAALDFAARFPTRARTLVLASTIAGARTAETRAMLQGLLPKGWSELPPEFKELGPSYRAGNPAGTQRWIELEKQARHGPPPAPGAPRRMFEPAALPPLLAITGDADLYAPPPLMRAFVQGVPGAELAIVAEAGHALFWEQPDAFNRTVLSFLHRHRKRPS